MNADPTKPPRKTAEEKNAAVRAQIEPLAPGERPRVLKVAAVYCALLPTANLTALALNSDTLDTQAKVLSIIFAVILYAMAIGMWRAVYGALISFQGFLVLSMILGAFRLIFATGWLELVALILILGISGWLFWKLIRIMGRIQAASRISAGE
jgi:K+-sensing histidine kinase KdpD